MSIKAVGCEVIAETLDVNVGAIYGIRELVYQRRLLPAMVYSYFSILIEKDGAMTVANFMWPTSVPLKIRPTVWHYAEGRLRQVKAPPSLARRAWLGDSMKLGGR